MANKQTGVTATSDPIELPFGEGALAVSSQSSLASAIQISIGDGIWVADKDATEPAANGVYAIEAGAPCWARLNVTSGSCTVQIYPQAREKYK